MPTEPPPPPGPGGASRPEHPDLRLVSRDFLRVMGTRVTSGRGFLDSDRAGAPQVMLINQTLARSGLLGLDPVGQRIYAAGTSPWEIVGIVEDVRQAGLDQEPGPQVFIDFRQLPIPAEAAARRSPPFYAVRTDDLPESLTPVIRRVVRQLDPHATLDRVATTGQLVAGSMVRPRLYAVLLGIFAAVAVALAVVGLYGLLAYAVAQRTREIGIRMALGAARSDVMRLVLGQSLALIALGLALGLTSAAIVTRALAGLLFGLTPRDPATFAAAALLFAAVATAAVIIPARKATKVDPVIALRSE